MKFLMLQTGEYLAAKNHMLKRIYIRTFVPTYGEKKYYTVNVRNSAKKEDRQLYRQLGIFDSYAAAKATMYWLVNWLAFYEDGIFEIPQPDADTIRLRLPDGMKRIKIAANDQKS